MDPPVSEPDYASYVDRRAKNRAVRAAVIRRQVAILREVRSTIHDVHAIAAVRRARHRRG
jgi:hypothetical protein